MDTAARNGVVEELDDRETIPVFFGIDEPYAPYLAVAICSLFENASPKYRYRVHVMHQDVGEEVQSRIMRLARPGCEIEFAPMEEYIHKVAHVAEHASMKLRGDYFTLTIFYRLFIPVMFPQYTKGIYLDSDIVVPGDISKMYETDLGDNLLGVIHDYSISGLKPLVDYTEMAVGVPYETYFNSGILLMNMERLREVHLAERFFEVLGKYYFDTVAPDQDYFNALCHGKVTYLDPAWDAMPCPGMEPMENPQLIHYNLFQKPWLYDGIQYADTFWEYAKKSGFIDEIQERKATYSDEQKAADAASIEGMFERAIRIAEQGQSFASVFNTGKEARL